MMAEPGSDQNFDDIANKFERNIYGTTKGKLRHELLLHHLTSQIDLTCAPMSILDAGGGTGVMTQSLMQMGHAITLSDVSYESLQLARHKIGKQQGVSYLHADIQSLGYANHFDLVVCHAVLEWLHNPIAVLPKLIDLVKVGGYLSLSFFNLDAFRFGNLLYANFDYVQQGMKKPNQVRLNPQQPLSPKAVLAALHTLPLDIQFKAGIRCFHDYLLDRQARERDYDKLKRLEIEYGTQSPYLWLGKYFYLIAKRIG